MACTRFSSAASEIDDDDEASIKTSLEQAIE